MTDIELLNKAKDAYYNTDTPILSDREYDMLVEKVGWETVGAPVLDSMKKVAIQGRPMLSLDKCHNVDEIAKFAKGQDLVASIKCDGLSARIIYENGKLVSSNTRGDSIVGADITEHIKHFVNVPLTIPTKERLVVDGEAIIFQHDFDEINVGGQFKNPRNLAAGTLASLDTSLCGSRKLSFIAWDVIEGGECPYYSENLSNLLSYGFTIVPMTSPMVTIDTINKVNDELLIVAKEKGIPCDGVVWKINDIAYGNTLGRTAHHWANAIAWKPARTEYETTLLNIELSLGRTGQLTPVAIYADVETGTATLNRASLHNISEMNAMLGRYPFVGQKIKIYQANEIIPQLSWAENSEETPREGKELIKCTCCPVCGGSLEIKDNDGVITAWCANENCEGKLSKRLEHYCSRDRGLDIRGLSLKTIEKLIDWGWVNEISDIYNLQSYASEWAAKEGFGAKSVGNILDAIEQSKTCSLVNFIGSLGIPLVGRTIAKELVKATPTWKEFRDKKDWSSLYGVGYEMEKALNNFDYTQADTIIEKYLTIEEVKNAGAASETLTGKVFCITGKLSRKRDDIKADIEAAGGKVGSSVTGKTNYLVCNAIEDTTKYKTAVSKGIPIITEEELMSMLK